MKICQNCGNDFTPLKANHRTSQKFCSKDCQKKFHLSYVLEYRKSSVEKTLRVVVGGCRARAKRKNMPCDIDQDYMVELLRSQEGKCAATGITLEATAGSGHSMRNPFTVSVDRKDSTKGYTKDNVQLVCVIYNEAKNIYGYETVIQMAKELIKMQECESVL